jgi:hypothetical protein
MLVLEAQGDGDDLFLAPCVACCWEASFPTGQLQQGDGLLLPEQSARAALANGMGV